MEHQTVAEAMRPCPLPISMTASIAEAAKRMAEEGGSWLLVGGLTGPVGVVSAGDIVRCTAMDTSRLEETAVSEVMTVGVVCCRATDSARSALRLIQRYCIHQVGVVDEQDRLSTVATAFDLIALILAMEKTDD